MTSDCTCEGAGLWKAIQADIDRYVFAIEHDALSRSLSLPRLVLSPRVWIIIDYRIVHTALNRVRPRSLGRVIAGLGLVVERFLRSMCGIQITPRAHIGPGLQLTHEGGVLIGPVRLGRHCTVSHGVTLGRGLLEGDGPGYEDVPTVGDRVWIGPGAVIAGPLTIGSDAVIGANSVVLRDVPPRGVVLGVPARLVSRKGSFNMLSYRGMADDAERTAALAGAMEDAPTQTRGPATGPSNGTAVPGSVTWEAS
jgi:serine O-acetyltransferase